MPEVASVSRNESPWVTTTVDPSTGQTIPVTHRDSWRAGCGANSHVRFGERAGETGQPKRWHRAPVRLHLANQALTEVRRRVTVQVRGRQGRKGTGNGSCGIG